MKILNSYQCPKCLTKLDDATCSDGDEPVDGDYCACVSCAAIGILHIDNDIISMVLASEEDLEELKLINGEQYDLLIYTKLVIQIETGIIPEYICLN